MTASGDRISEFKRLRPDDHQFAGVYEVLPFNAWYWAGWYDPMLAEEIGLHIEYPGYVVLRGGYVYPSKDTYAGCAVYIGKQLKSGANFSEDLRARIDAEVSELSDLLEHKALETSYAISKVARRFRKVTFYWAVGYFCGVEFEPYFREEAQRVGLSAESLADCVVRADTKVSQRQKDLLRLKELLGQCGIDSAQPAEEVIARVEQHADLQAAFERHLEVYDWIGMTGFMGEPLTLSALIGEVLNLKDTVHPVAHVKDLGRIGAIATNLQYLNQVGAEYFQIIGRRSIPLLEKAASRIGVTRHDLMYLTPNEVVAGLDAPHDARKAIERRKQLELAFYLASDGKTHLIEDQDAVRSVRQAFQPEQSMDGIEEVRGVCGSKGKADGKARIVMGASDFHKMQKGDVLVTSMTTPDFVPLMQKASAIVTDMGGLLSHAVIMSRELGKPCVIGTKFATQAFKDGDMVEVDAEKGVVRKI